MSATRARHYDHRQVMGTRPVEYGRQRNRLVALAMDQKRIGGNCREREMVHCDPDQHHPRGRAPFRAQLLGEQSLHRCAKREPGEHHGVRTRSGAARVREHRGEVRDLSTAFVVAAFARTDAAEIRSPGDVSELRKRACKGLRDLVVERAAEQRMRMGDEGYAACSALRGIHRAFDTSCRSRDELAPRRLADQMRSRSTLRPDRAR